MFEKKKFNRNNFHGAINNWIFRYGKNTKEIKAVSFCRQSSLLHWLENTKHPEKTKSTTKVNRIDNKKFQIPLTDCKREILETRLTTDEATRKLKPRQRKRTRLDCVFVFMHEYACESTASNSCTCIVHAQMSNALYSYASVRVSELKHIFLLHWCYAVALQCSFPYSTYMCMEVKVALYVWYVYVCIHSWHTSSCSDARWYSAMETLIHAQHHTHAHHIRSAGICCCCCCFGMCTKRCIQHSI